MSEVSRQRLLDTAEVYALHAVSPAEQAEIERDLGSVDDTARVQFNVLVSEIQETLALVSVLDATEPPARLRDRVLDDIPRTTQVTPSPASGSNVTSMHRRRRGDGDGAGRWRTTMMAAAAAVVVVVGGVVVATQVIGGGPNPTQAEQIVAAPDTRQQTAEFPGGGTVTLQYSKESDAMVVSLDGVPPPAEGQDYQMWFVEGTPRSAGLVTPDLLTGDDERVIEGMGSATNFAFSLEPAGGSPEPTEVITAIVLSA